MADMHIPAEVVEAAAKELWRRYAPSHHMEWENESAKAEYLDPALAAITAALAAWVESGMAKAAIGYSLSGGGIEANSSYSGNGAGAFPVLILKTTEAT